MTVTVLTLQPSGGRSPPTCHLGVWGERVISKPLCVKGHDVAEQNIISLGGCDEPRLTQQRSLRLARKINSKVVALPKEPRWFNLE